MQRPVRVQEQIQDYGQICHGNVAQEPRRGSAGVRGHWRDPFVGFGLLDELLQEDVVEVLEQNLVGEQAHHDGPERDPAGRFSQIQSVFKVQSHSLNCCVLK